MIFDFLSSSAGGKNCAGESSSVSYFPLCFRTRKHKGKYETLLLSPVQFFPPAELDKKSNINQYLLLELFSKSLTILFSDQNSQNGARRCSKTPPSGMDIDIYLHMFSSARHRKNNEICMKNEGNPSKSIKPHTEGLSGPKSGI